MELRGHLAILRRTSSKLRAASVKGASARPLSSAAIAALRALRSHVSPKGGVKLVDCSLSILVHVSAQLLYLACSLHSHLTYSLEPSDSSTLRQGGLHVGKLPTASSLQSQKTGIRSSREPGSWYSSRQEALRQYSIRAFGVRPRAPGDDRASLRAEPKSWFKLKPRADHSN
eukprot:6212783-Pleurochrysis_carterae.AAC.2